MGGTQFVFVQDFGDNSQERYMFGGRLHPLEDPCNFAPQWGSHKMAPLRFNDQGIPEVYQKKSFDWKSYDYATPTYDQHDKEYYQPVCDDKHGSEERIQRSDATSTRTLLHSVQVHVVITVITPKVVHVTNSVITPKVVSASRSTTAHQIVVMTDLVAFSVYND